MGIFDNFDGHPVFFILSFLSNFKFIFVSLFFVFVFVVFVFVFYYLALVVDLPEFRHTSI